MAIEGGLSSRFLAAFILQALLISVAAFLGVWLARFVLEDVLIEQALEQEAAWFWAQRADDPHARPPHARNIIGYVVADAVSDAGDDAGTTGEGAVPSQLLAFGPGIHRLDAPAGLRSLHVSERGGERLLLLFDGAGVNLLTTYFGLVPLALVLIALYLTAWVGYRATHRVLSPITALAREIRRMDVGALDPDVLRAERFAADPNEEVAVLAGALADFTERLDAFVDRERNFTRDASHELRSPLTVIAMAVEVLRADPELGDAARGSVDRIDRAVRDMRELVEAFLLLARESETALEQERVCVNALVEEELERTRLTQPGAVQAQFEAHGRLHVLAPRQVLASVIGNLIRNAFSYTHGGRVRISLEAGELLIEDTGVGMAPEELARAFDPFYRAGMVGGGHGVGLTIVRRLSDRFGWPVSIDSTPGVGTRVRIRFPASDFEREARAAS
ncbi:MAG TPA: HAMP domain-containing sensor histidine kinase [Pseudomonadales bacterium]|nr:HAMP domain-containing sensor histidine kinase [Pseudomonadales bacterium]